MNAPEIPYRMYTADVVALAKISRSTLLRRVRAGQFPKPVDRGKQFIFSGIAVYAALGIIQSEAAGGQSPWSKALDEMRREAGRD